jgi:hypothetical protein
MAKADPTQVYTINPDHMQQGIDWYLTPVIDKLAQIRDGFTAAQGEVKAAHDSQTPGWFGGEGHGEVPMAISSFLNEAAYQLEQLCADQTELHKSLADYRTMLQNHLTWARDTDLRQADAFRGIQRMLDQRGE